MNERDIGIEEARILLVDDNRENLAVLSDLLMPEGYHIHIAMSGEVALDIVKKYTPDLILLDVMMPGQDGFEVCRQLKSQPQTWAIPVIFLTARDDTADVVKGFEEGGADYIVKPFKKAELKARVATHLQLRRLVQELTRQKEALEAEMTQRKALTEERDRLTNRLSLLSDEETRRWGIDGFIGKSKTLQKILTSIERLQQSTSTSVLITGESGTGKELIARAIHFGSNRATGPFVPVNCSAVPTELADALFFGHTKGAFTGADHDREGYFELAHTGTLFLDEIGDMPPDMQAKLLRTLETRTVRPVGGRNEKPIDVRIVSATNADLQTRIPNGQFRQDLYYRLAGFLVEVPPLRDRKEDIPLLTQHFLNLFAAEMGVHDPTLTQRAQDALVAHVFPGNIRELKNIIERALIESDGWPIEARHLVLSNTGPPPAASSADLAPNTLPWDLDRAEAAMVKRAIMETGGNMSKAAKLLGIHRSRLYRILAQADNPD